MFIMDPSKRITIKEILNDPYFNEELPEPPSDPKNLPKIQSI